MSTTATELNSLSLRSYLSSFLDIYGGRLESLNGQCLRFLYPETSNFRVNSILNSAEQGSLLSVIENVDSKRCPSTGACPERDQLVRLYISEESALNKELLDLLQPTIIQTPDSIFHNYGVNYLFMISFLLNLYFVYQLVKAKLPVKRTRSKKFAYLKYIIPIFLLICYGVSYHKHYKEAVAARLATTAARDPCGDKEWKVADILSGFLTVSSEKSDCQRFIESHVGWAFLDVNPLDPLLEIIGKLLFGWISPLGHHLNTFYRKVVLGVPLAVQVIFFVITILAILSSVKYWPISLPKLSLGSKSKREKMGVEDAPSLGRISWRRTPSPEPVRRTTRATARRAPSAKSRSRTRKEN